MFADRCKVSSRFVILIVSVMLGACGGAADSTAPEPAGNAGQPMLVLYASLPAERVARVANAYRETTGILVNYMLDSDEVLIDKLIRKEHRPGADVLLISGAGHLASAVDGDVLRPINSAALDESIPESMRDPDKYWYGLGVRAEAIVYDPRRVDGATLRGYSSLGNAAWHGQLCLQRGITERMRSLVAAMIVELGEREAELVVRGWRANLATSVFDEQADLLSAVESGECAVGIVSSDEVAGFFNAGLAKNIRWHFPPAEEGGTLQALTAAGISRHANDAGRGREFLEWLASPAGQRELHEAGGDYPANAAVTPVSPLDRWPTYAASPQNASRTGFLYQDAIELLERARLR